MDLSSILSGIFKKKPSVSGEMASGALASTEDALPNLSIAPKAMESLPATSGTMDYKLPIFGNPGFDVGGVNTAVLPINSGSPSIAASANPVIPSFVKTDAMRPSRAPGKSITDEFNARIDNPGQRVDWNQSQDPFAQDRFNSVTNNGAQLPQRGRKETLRHIALGALQGAAGSPENPLGGLIGGAAAGGIGGTINPVAARSAEFNTFKLPQLLQNRQMAQQQALNEAKVNAENQKAQQESATAENKYIRATGDGGFVDVRNGKRYGSKPLPKLLNLGPGAVAYNPETGQPQFKNDNLGRQSNQVFKAVKNLNGQPFTMLSTDARFSQLPDYVAPKGMSEAALQAQADKNAAAEDTFNKSEEQFKDAMAAFENAKQDALKRGVKLDAVKDDEDVKSAMDYLKQNYPRRAEVGLGDQKVPYVKERSDYKPVRPARLQGNANGGGQRGRTISATTAMDLLNR